MYRVATANAALRAAAAPRDGPVAALRPLTPANGAVRPATGSQRARRCQIALCGRGRERYTAVSRALPGDSEGYGEGCETTPEVRYLQNLADSLRRQPNCQAKVTPTSGSAWNVFMPFDLCGAAWKVQMRSCNAILTLVTVPGAALELEMR